MLAGMTVLAAAAAEAATEAATEAAHSGSGGLPQLDAHTFAPQIFWLVLTFAVLYFVLSKVALPRIGEVLEERADRITRDLEAAQRLKDDTDKALADYEKALADARAKASTIAKDTRDQLAAETESKKASVEKTLAGKLQDAEQRIAATKTKALSAVNDIAADTAGAVVSKLIGQNVSADDIKKALSPSAGE
ncbi:MAG: F0F1 ATP synthase subunit B [Hyphomicrobiaceae bacterium]|nr:F0F1 ATP synthase subunit B [Hyphomicrobiaceae bacterium]